MRYVLSCPRIKSLNITKAEILDALRDSSLVHVKEGEEGGGSTYLYRDSPLPELKERPHHHTPHSHNNKRFGRGGEGEQAGAGGSGQSRACHQGAGRNPHAAG